MIKKVSSWVLGSFFRQFGRFLFFLVLGVLVVLLAQHNNINFKITDLLGIETIKASEVQQAWVTNISDSNGNWSDSEFLGSWYVQRYASVDVVQQGGASLVPQISLPRHGDIYINGYLESSTYMFGNDLQMNCSAYAGDGVTCVQWSLQDGTAVDLQFWLNSYGNQCKIEWNNNGINVGTSSKLFFNATCQTQDRTIGTFYYYMLVRFGDSPSTTPNYKLGISRSWKYEITASNAIQDQTDIMTDTNTTSDVSTADSFFNDTNSTSESALADIVSTPLTLLNNLSTGAFSDICATLNNKQICLPSGDIIWNRQHGGSGVHDHWFRGGSTQAFITFFNLVVGGFILYKCLISLFHSVHKMLDPTQTYVEVMKL